MHDIAILGAMDVEARIYLDQMTDVSERREGHFLFREGTLCGRKVYGLPTLGLFQAFDDEKLKRRGDDQNALARNTSARLSGQLQKRLDLRAQLASSVP